MKKSIVLALCLIMPVFFAACGTKSPSKTETPLGTKEQSNSLIGMPNPIIKTDKDGLISKLGFYMGVPDGAENVSYSIISDTVAEVRFTLDGMDYTARMKDYPNKIEIGTREAMEEYIALSGYHYGFKSMDTCKIGYCDGEIIEFKNTESGKTIQIVCWDDVAPGFLYTLSVESNDLDGFDITAAANEVFIPMQSDVG